MTLPPMSSGIFLCLSFLIWERKELLPTALGKEGLSGAVFLDHSVQSLASGNTISQCGHRLNTWG